LYQAAQKNGVRVVLDGFDGDTTVSHGKVYFLELARSNHWRMLLREVRGYAKNFDESATALMWAYYWRFGLEPKLPKSRISKPVQQIGSKLYRQALKRDKNIQPKETDFHIDLNPDFLERVSLAEHHRSLRELRPHSPKTEREDHYTRFLAGTIPAVLENLDKAAAPFEVEVRYPFWDKRLAEFCLSLPAHQKMHHGFTRMIMRRAMDGILPKEVQWRPGKADLSHAFSDGLGKFELEGLNNSIKTNRNLLEKFINVDSLTEKYEGFANGKANLLDLLKISSSVSLALWLQSAKLNN
jgi:asparagine synthase (glutamine-hydrolysing)